MAPSIIAESPTTEAVVPVKADSGKNETKPKVRRIIDEEGGKTTASVCHD
jgi:taurine dioxygenase/sulfonate dioxygenase